MHSQTEKWGRRIVVAAAVVAVTVPSASASASSRAAPPSEVVLPGDAAAASVRRAADSWIVGVGLRHRQGGWHDASAPAVLCRARACTAYGFDKGQCDAHRIATNAAFGAGTILVAAAGNEFEEGNPSDQSPSADPHVITAAALKDDLSPADFSNAHDGVDLRTRCRRAGGRALANDEDGVSRSR